MAIKHKKIEANKLPVDDWRRDLQFETQLGNQSLSFKTTWGLFSPREIDRGTQLLIEYLKIATDANCLDLGCGYGALGLYLARMAPEGQTTLVDKDFVAIEYAKRNAELNRIKNIQVFLSNGLAQVEANDFDLIVTNLPAKSGKELYYLFLIDALAKLKPGGQLYVVSITGLRKFIEKACLDVFGNYQKLKQAPEYTVATAYRN